MMLGTTIYQLWDIYYEQNLITALNGQRRD